MVGRGRSSINLRNFLEKKRQKGLFLSTFPFFTEGGYPTISVFYPHEVNQIVKLSHSEFVVNRSGFDKLLLLIPENVRPLKTFSEEFLGLPNFASHFAHFLLSAISRNVINTMSNHNMILWELGGLREQDMNLKGGHFWALSILDEHLTVI